MTIPQLPARAATTALTRSAEAATSRLAHEILEPTAPEYPDLLGLTGRGFIGAKYWPLASKHPASRCASRRGLAQGRESAHATVLEQIWSISPVCAVLRGGLRCAD